MKVISNSDIIRKIDYNYPVQGKPAFIENIKTVSDPGFRLFLSEVISSDENRRKEFKKKNEK